MNFVGISGADQAQFLALQRSLPHVAVLSADPAGALSSRPRLSLALLLGFHVLLCVPFLVPTVPFGRPLFLGALTALLVAIVSSTTGLGQAEDYVLSIICVGYFQRFVAFYICSPPPERNGLLARKGRDGPPRNWRLADRLAAVCAIYGNYRGVGWAWEVRTRGYSSAPAPPRWTFVRAQLSKLGAILALTVPCHMLYPTVAEVLSAPLWVRSYRSNLCVFGVYSILDGCYILSSIAAVSLGLSTAEEWPPLFGRLTSCWSIRRAWGFWHQNFTQIALLHAAYLSRVLGVPPAHRHLLTVLTGFVLSAVLHGVPAWTISRTDGGMAFYFVLQAVGIALEERAWKPLGRVLGVPAAAAKAAGFAWTLAWFALTNILFVEGLVAIGMQPIIDWRWVLGYETVRIN